MIRVCDEQWGFTHRHMRVMNEPTEHAAHGFAGIPVRAHDVVNVAVVTGAKPCNMGGSSSCVACNGSIIGVIAPCQIRALPGCE